MGFGKSIAVSAGMAVVLVAGSVGSILPAAAGADPKTPEDGDSPYQEWVKRYSHDTMIGRTTNGGTGPLMLVVTAVGGDERARDSPLGYGVTVSGTELATTGHVWGFSRSSFSSKGFGGGPPISTADLQRLTELLARLPDDQSQLPPIGRRMLLQAKVDGRSAVRVYDRAHAPDLVWEVLRLSRSGLRSHVPTFKPQRYIAASGFQHGGFLQLSSDGQQILFASTNGPLEFWEPTTHEFLREVRRPGVSWGDLAFSLDGAQVAVTGSGECVVMNTQTWKIIQQLKEPRIGRRRHGLGSPQFTRDSRHLLLECSEPALRIFDTDTWERVDSLPEVPQKTLQFYPSPKGSRAVIRSRNGDIVLQDVVERQQIAMLDRSARIGDIAFAPNAELVAVVTREQRNGENSRVAPRIRVWNAKTGELVHELRPFEHSPESVQGLAWSPDGRYLLAATKSHRFFTSVGISVFSITSGRHRGELTGCPTNIKGLAFLPDTDQVVAGCNDGNIRFWNWQNILEQIAEFEVLLSTPQTPPAELDSPREGL